jgi:hypothetical protein
VRLYEFFMDSLDNLYAVSFPIEFYPAKVCVERSVPKNMVRLKAERNQSRPFLSAWQFSLIGLVIILLGSSFAFSQTAATEASGHGSGSAGSAQQQPAGSVSAPDTDAEIIQELERMRNRIQQLESELKQRRAGNSTDKPAGAQTQEPGSTSEPAPQPAVQTESSATENKPPQPATSTVGASITPPAIAASAPPVRTAQPRGSSAAVEPASQETAAQSSTQSAANNNPPKPDPFSLYDYTWLTGNPRIKEVPFDTKFFTPEIRFDVNYTYDFNHPADDTIGGSSEIFRAQEFQVEQAGVGGDFHWNNVQGRLMTQFGMYSETTPRNDASPARGGWDLDTAYRYVSEAYGGYHFNVLDGVNVQAGIFMSYIGLWSYYNFDNWSYQPSYVSSNTPWFFNGMRVQIFPTPKLKIEPWLINGWQSYGRFNNRLGVGGQILWRPNGSISVVGNQYTLGADALGVPGRIRYHTDDSIQVKYYERPAAFLDRMAFTFTGDAGCEHGGDFVAGTAVSCDTTGSKIISGVRRIAPKQSFLGFMAYNRWWFKKDLYAVTIGGGKINNPGRYLVLLPPINGATAITGTPYFTENPGDPFKAWDASLTFDYMPSQYITFRSEYNHRAANVPYFSGRGGITPPGGDNGNPGALVPGWSGPDLVRDENRMTFAVLVMF